MNYDKFNESDHYIYLNSPEACKTTTRYAKIRAKIQSQPQEQPFMNRRK